MGGLGAWRKFEPDRFTDDEVETFKTEWRAAHPKIKRFWYDIDRAAWTAVRERGRIVRCGRVAFKCDGAFLQLKLPSGRKLSYPQPRIIEDEREQHRSCSPITPPDNSRTAATVKAPMAACGPRTSSPALPAICSPRRCCAIEAAGYPIVLHVHDELVAEVPIGFGSTEEFTQLMTRKPAWALELPIAASAWTRRRATANERSALVLHPADARAANATATQT